MYGPLWEDFESDIIQQTERAADSIAREITYEQGVVKAHVEALDEKIDRLAMICRAMHELLREHTSITDQDLAQRITDIDLRDGHEDGKASPIPTKCPNCDSMICKKFNRCLFCGFKDESGDPFDTV